MMKDVSATMSLFQRNDLLETVQCQVPHFTPRVDFTTTDKDFADVTIANFRTYDCTSARVRKIIFLSTVQWKALF